MLNDILVDLLQLQPIIQNKIQTKILIASTQYPGYGGAATNSYYLIKFLREKGFKVAGVFFENGNPRCDTLLDGMFIRPRNIGKDLIVPVVNYLGKIPDIIYCKNWLTPLLIRPIFTESPIVYLVSGSLHATYLADFRLSAQKIINTPVAKLYTYFKQAKNNYILLNTQKEAQSIKLSKYCIFNSSLTLQIFKKFYPNVLKDFFIKDTSRLSNISPSYQTYETKQYDLVVIVSDIKRMVKNVEFALKIIQDKRLDHYTKLIIGDNTTKITKVNIPNLTLEGRKSLQEVYNILQKSRIILIPSYYDSSPNILNEAIQYGCKVITSKNVGSAEVLDPSWVCHDVYDSSEWVDCICTVSNQ